MSSDHDKLIALGAEFRGFRELHAEQLVHRDEALRLQAVEYERRLDNLNHAHEQAEDRSRDYVSTVKFEDFVRAGNATANVAAGQLNEKLTGITNQLDSFAQWKAAVSARVGILIGLGAVFGTAVGGIAGHIVFH